jgi:RimJ/RimL family protein N-acetyltransferase
MSVTVQDVLPKDACALLEKEPLKHLVTLKILNGYSEYMRLRLIRDADQWALLSLLPAERSEWDKKAYPDADLIVLIDGNNETFKAIHLDSLPRGCLIIKTGDQRLKDALSTFPGLRQTMAFTSFTTPEGWFPPEGRLSVGRLQTPDPDAFTMFQRNGYDPEELDRYFANGACWFSRFSESTLASACFIFQNHASVWEIAGVHTLVEFRNRGYGKSVVLAALGYLHNAGLIPRYQAKSDNAASIALARSCGMREFITVGHYSYRNG